MSSNLGELAFHLIFVSCLFRPIMLLKAGICENEIGENSANSTNSKKLSVKVSNQHCVDSKHETRLSFLLFLYGQDSTTMPPPRSSAVT
jgi:hypothetical protein